jgi:AraC-like DNA-binding protein
MYKRDSVLLAVRDELSRKPTSHLSDVASSLGVSRMTIERALNTEGARFHDLRTEFILDRAKEMLASSPRSKKEVAYALGFSSPGAFCQFLRRHEANERHGQPTKALPEKRQRKQARPPDLAGAPPPNQPPSR